jgi:acyl-coenzyme A thioesterase PaaI-like protein
MADLAPYTPPPLTFQHFHQNPHLSALLSSPLYHSIEPFTHISTRGTPQHLVRNEFFMSTLSSPIGISHCVNLRLKSPPLIPPSPSPSSNISDLGPPHALWLLALGAPGLSGKPSTAHGGALSAILDETLTRTAELHQQPGADGVRAHVYTVNLESTYRKPVSVPGDCVVRAWVVRREGRKCWVRGSVGSADGGEVFTEGIVFCIQGKPTPNAGKL